MLPHASTVSNKNLFSYRRGCIVVIDCYPKRRPSTIAEFFPKDWAQLKGVIEIYVYFFRVILNTVTDAERSTTERMKFWIYVLQTTIYTYNSTSNVTKQYLQLLFTDMYRYAIAAEFFINVRTRLLIRTHHMLLKAYENAIIEQTPNQDTLHTTKSHSVEYNWRADTRKNSTAAVTTRNVLRNKNTYKPSLEKFAP